MFFLTAVLLLGQVAPQTFNGQAPNTFNFAYVATYNPPGAVTGQGVFRDILTHCPAAERADKWMGHRTTWGHEMAHSINAELRRRTGQLCFYLGDGNYVAFSRQPKTTLQQVARCLPVQFHGTFTEKLYLHQQQKDWNNEPLYLLDEWSAFKMGNRVGHEEKIPMFGQDGFEREFVNFGNALIHAVNVDDKDYPERRALIEFVEFLKRS